MRVSASSRLLPWDHPQSQMLPYFLITAFSNTPPTKSSSERLWAQGRPRPSFKGFHFIKSGLPRWLSGKEFACQCRRERETWIEFLCKEDPLEEDMAAHSRILAWRIPMDRGDWWATVHGVAKSQTGLSTHSIQYPRAWHLTPWFRALIPLAKSIIQRTSLVVQWLRIPSKQGMQILFLVGELRSHLPWSN